MSGLARVAVAAAALVGATGSWGCAGPQEARAVDPSHVRVPGVACDGGKAPDYEVRNGRTLFWCPVGGKGDLLIGALDTQGNQMSTLRYHVRGDGTWDGVLERLGTSRLTAQIERGEPAECVVEERLPGEGGKTELVLSAEYFYEQGHLRRARRYTNGRLTEEETLDAEGRRDGVYRRYRADGSIELEEGFAHGKQEGAFTLWNKQGIKIREEGRANGVLHGAMTMRDPKGTTRFTATYHHGQLHGEFTVWTADGQVSDQGRLEHGEGPFVQIDESGNVRRRGALRGDGWEGAFTDFDASGKRVAEGFLLHGLAHGALTTYWPSGQVKMRVQVLAGVPYGLVEGMHENGKVSFRGEVRTDGPTMPVGVWQRFDQSGSLTSEERYERGVLRSADGATCSASTVTLRSTEWELVLSSSTVACATLQTAR